MQKRGKRCFPRQRKRNILKSGEASNETFFPAPLCGGRFGSWDAADHRLRSKTGELRPGASVPVIGCSRAFFIHSAVPPPEGARRSSPGVWSPTLVSLPPEAEGLPADPPPYRPEPVRRRACPCGQDCSFPGPSAARCGRQCRNTWYKSGPFPWGRPSSHPPRR